MLFFSTRKENACNIISVTNWFFAYITLYILLYCIVQYKVADIKYRTICPRKWLPAIRQTKRQRLRWVCVRRKVSNNLLLTAVSQERTLLPQDNFTQKHTTQLFCICCEYIRGIGNPNSAYQLSLQHVTLQFTLICSKS